jgi:hypothetical protein
MLDNENQSNVMQQEVRNQQVSRLRQFCLQMLKVIETKKLSEKQHDDIQVNYNFERIIEQTIEKYNFWKDHADLIRQDKNWLETELKTLQNNFQLGDKDTINTVFNQLIEEQEGVFETLVGQLRNRNGVEINEKTNIANNSEETLVSLDVLKNQNTVGYTFCSQEFDDSRTFFCWNGMTISKKW